MMRMKSDLILFLLVSCLSTVAHCMLSIGVKHKHIVAGIGTCWYNPLLRVFTAISGYIVVTRSLWTSGTKAVTPKQPMGTVIDRFDLPVTSHDKGLVDDYGVKLSQQEGYSGKVGQHQAEEDFGIADDFIIQPVAAPVCGLNEATWGRAQSPPHTPPPYRNHASIPHSSSDIDIDDVNRGASTPNQQPVVEVDIPMIVPVAAERLGEREDTWGKPQEF